MTTYNVFSPDFSYLADPWGKILTSIICRKTPNAYLIEKVASAKGGADAMPEKFSYTPKIITYRNLIEILLY
jgi:hypothetical protein